MTRVKNARYAVILILAAAALINVSLYPFQQRRTEVAPEELAKQLREINGPHPFDVLLGEIRPLLGDSAVVGFAAQSSREGMRIAPELAGIYYQTQYALCPIIVDYSTDHDHVLAFNLDPSVATHLIVDTNSHDLVAATQRGVLLFEKR